MVATKLMSVASIIISIGIGFFTFYIMSNVSKGKKKMLMEEMVIQFTNFIIFIWVGKVLLHITSFIKNPLAIVAYPSNSEAFYLAVLFSIIVLVYKSKRGKLDVVLFIKALIPVVFVASFLYEFIQLVGNGNTYSLGNMALFTGLVVLYYLIRDYLQRMVIIVMLFGWSVGSIILSFMQPFVTVFGFIIAPWFVGVFFIANILIIIYHRVPGSHVD